LSNVERVEIIRGPAAVQHGSSAMGGVINVITKQGAGADEIWFSAEGGIGSDALHRERIAFVGGGGGFDFALGLTNSGRSDLTTSGGRRWYNTEIGRSTLLNADLGYSIAGNHRAGINFNYGNISSLLGGGFSGATPDRCSGTDRASCEYRKYNNNMSLAYAGHTADRIFDWAANYSFGSAKSDFPISAWAPAHTDTVNNRVFNVQLGYTERLVSLSIGFDSLKYEIEETVWRRASGQTSAGFYFSGRLRLLDERLIFSAGGRYDAYNLDSEIRNQDVDNFGGSVGAAYLPTNWLKLRVNYAEGFKMPTISQIEATGNLYISNPDLGAEKSKTVEFGIDINWNFIDVGLTYFHSAHTDKIVGHLVSEDIWQFQNLDGATLAGLESAFRADIGRAFNQNYSLTPFMSFTWLGTRRNEDAGDTRRIFYQGEFTDYLPNTPDWMISYGLDYNNPTLKLRTRINVSRHGETFQQNFSEPMFQTPAGNWISPWQVHGPGTVVNLSAERELARLGVSGGALTLRAEITNLFDGKNEMYMNYPGTGRSFYAGLRYGF
jgi:vitamin B12 transporter